MWTEQTICFSFKASHPIIILFFFLFVKKRKNCFPIGGISGLLSVLKDSGGWRLIDRFFFKAKEIFLFIRGKGERETEELFCDFEVVGVDKLIIVIVF